MLNSYIFLCIVIMAGVTFLIRLLPLLLFRKPITNRFVKSFLYYSPYVTLAVMTFPAILETTGNYFTAVLGFAAAVIMALCGVHFVIVTFGTCLFVFIIQLFIL